MITTDENFQAATYRRFAPAPGTEAAPGARIEASALVAEGETVVQLAGHMRYPTPRTVSTNRT